MRRRRAGRQPAAPCSARHPGRCALGLPRSRRPPPRTCAGCHAPCMARAQRVWTHTAAAACRSQAGTALSPHAAPLCRPHRQAPHAGRLPSGGGALTVRCAKGDLQVDPLPQVAGHGEAPPLPLALQADLEVPVWPGRTGCHACGAERGAQGRFVSGQAPSPVHVTGQLLTPVPA